MAARRSHGVLEAVLAPVAQEGDSGRRLGNRTRELRGLEIGLNDNPNPSPSGEDKVLAEGPHRRLLPDMRGWLERQCSPELQPDSGRQRT